MSALLCQEVQKLVTYYTASTICMGINTCISRTKETSFVQAKAVHGEKDIVGLEYIIWYKLLESFH